MEILDRRYWQLRREKKSSLQVFIGTYSEACQTSKKERFAKIANVWKLRTVSAKCSTLNVCQGYIVITTVSSQEKLEELVQCKYSKNWPNLAFLSAVDLFSYFLLKFNAESKSNWCQIFPNFCDVFRNLLNIYGEGFCESSLWKKAINYLCKKTPLHASKIFMVCDFASSFLCQSGSFNIVMN